MSGQPSAVPPSAGQPSAADRADVDPEPADRPDSRRRELRRAVLTNAGFALLYAVAVVAGRASRLEGSALAVVWPAAAVGLLWLAFTWGRMSRLLPAALLLSVLAGVANALTGTGWVLGSAFAVANGVQALVACAIMHRLQLRAGCHPWRLRRTSDLTALVLASVGGSLAAAAIGPVAMWWVNGMDLPTTAAAWALRNAVSTFAFAALALRVIDRSLPAALSPRGGSVAGAGELAVATAAMLAAYAVVFGQPIHLPVAFLLLPLSLWASRFPTTATAAHVLLVGVVVVSATVDGRGPLSVGSPLTRVLLAQAFVAVAGLVSLILALHRDERSELLDHLREAQQDSARQASLLGAVFETITEAVSVYDARGVLVLRNPAAERMSATPPAGLSSADWTSFYDVRHPDGRPMPVGDVPVARALQGESVTDVDVLVSSPNRPEGRILQMSAHPMPTSPGTTWSGGAVLAFHDVTGQVRTQARLADSEQRFRVAFDTAPVGMMLVGLTGAQATRIQRVNQTLCAFTGRSEEELLTLDMHALTHVDEREACEESFAPFLTGQAHHARIEKRYQHADGSTRWGLLSATVAESGAGAGDGGQASGRELLCLIEDITARKAAEAALTHQALHDALTGLANRALLSDRLDHALAASARTGKPVGVLYLDLDGFKDINDDAGHAAGDETLRQVAERLSGCVRPGDTVARPGGDEFVVLCPDAGTHANLQLVADRILAGLAPPMRLATGTFRVGVSIGVTLSTPRSTGEQLLREADEAMYEAKRAGTNRVVTHDPGSDVRAHHDARLVPALHDALTRQQFVLHGQPVVDLDSGRVVAVETLLRWRHPERGLLSPTDFLDVAESSPLMTAIGQWVLQEACRMASTWSEALGATAPPVHVNVFGRQLDTPELPAEVVATLQRHGLPGHRLVLEIREPHLARIGDPLKEGLRGLRDRGVRIAVDDVGTGDTSLARLTDFPADALKIDESFVAGLGADPSCDAVARAILGVGQALGVAVIAEGVETPQQAQILRRYGADTGQGYLYSPPRPEAELLQYLRDAARLVVG